MTDVVLLLLGLLAIVLAWIMLYDSNRFVVRRASFADGRIRRKVRAVVVADLHNKRYGRENRELLSAIREQKPDFLLIAGDLLTAKPGKSLEPALHFLGELKKDFPIYYGYGNHEQRLKLYPKTYGAMGEEYGKALEEMGIEPLANCHRVLEDCGICIYGVELAKFFYRRSGQAVMEEDYLKETLGKPRTDTYTVLLAHNPDYFPQYAAWGADLVVSGHVHGGVVRIPFLGRGVLSPSLRLFPRYDGGIFREGNATMVLSRGLGMHTVPLRLFNPGELWVVEFEPAGGSEG